MGRTEVRIEEEAPLKLPEDDRSSFARSRKP